MLFSQIVGKMEEQVFANLIKFNGVKNRKIQSHRSQGRIQQSKDFVKESRLLLREIDRELNREINKENIKLSEISNGNGRRSFYQQNNCDTSLNISPFRNSVNILQQTNTNELNDVSLTLQNRLDYHVLEIDDDLEVLASMFYTTLAKKRVFKAFRLILEEQQPQNKFSILGYQSFSLCNYENESQNYQSQEESLDLPSGSSKKAKLLSQQSLVHHKNCVLLDFNEIVANDFYDTYNKIKVCYNPLILKLVISRSNRTKMLRKLSTMKKQSRNTSRDHQKTYRNVDEINLPFNRQQFK